MAQSELAQIIERHAQREGLQAMPVLPSLFLFRASTTSNLIHSVYEPSICVVAQGHKEMLLGDQRFSYDPEHFLLVSVSLPVSGRMLVASPEQPHLAMHINLDAIQIAEMAMELDIPTPTKATNSAGLAVHRLTPMLSDAILRFVRLLDTPQHIPVLAPLIQRELCYLLLSGPQGAQLRESMLNNGQTQRVVHAIDKLRDNYHQPLRVEQLAKDLGMSVASLHRHFKAVTAMSPLQYQKVLRLQEARKLMLSESLDALTASVYVGYESASQFSREYRRLFGAPPARDIAQLRANATNQQ